jgi:hypothetical protein
MQIGKSSKRDITLNVCYGGIDGESKNIFGENSDYFNVTVRVVMKTMSGETRD